MRDRRPGDWVTDLAGRHRLEDEVAQALASHPELILARRATHALDALDFTVLGPGERLAQVELKAKHQPYREWAQLWPELAERDLFILDELALRRIVDAGRYGFLLVRDMPEDRWAVWSTTELVLATKVRVGRRLVTGVERTKGKVLIDLSGAAALTTTLPGALSSVATLVGFIDRRWSDIAPWPCPERSSCKGEAS